MFLDKFSKNTQISNFVKFRPVGAELFHTDGRTDRQTDKYGEANSRSSQFCKRAQKELKRLIQNGLSACESLPHIWACYEEDSGIGG